MESKHGMETGNRDVLLGERAAEAARLEGCELLELSVRQRGSGSTLEVTLDRTAGVTVDDCARVSRRLAAMLEAETAFASPFILEVSSPGLTRRLASPSEYDHFRGRLVLIELSSPIAGERRLCGRLDGRTPDGATVLLHDQRIDGPVEIPFQAIAWTRLHLEVPVGKSAKPRKKR